MRRKRGRAKPESTLGDLPRRAALGTAAKGLTWEPSVVAVGGATMHAPPLLLDLLGGLPLPLLPRPLPPGVSCVSCITHAEKEGNPGSRSGSTHTGGMWGREIRHDLNSMEFSGIRGLGLEVAVGA